MDKLIAVNPRAITTSPMMSLLFEVERTPAVSIKPRLVLVAHTDHLIRKKRFNDQRQMHIQSLSWIVSTPDTLPRQLTYCASLAK